MVDRPREGVLLGNIGALDGLRGIAILLVLSFHSGFIRGGWLGVDLFFVLSGFLITSLLVNEWQTTERVSFRSFYRRRALRLLPALVAMVGTYVAYVLATGSPEQIKRTMTSALLGLTYTLNIYNYVAADGAPDWALQHLWSLATEEQFYLVWPPLLVLLLRRSLELKAALAWVGGTAVLAALLEPLLVTSADAILVGCVAGLAFTHGLVKHVAVGIRVPALVCAALLAMVLSQTHVAYHDGPAITVFGLASAAVIVACVCEQGWWFTRLASWAPLRYLGRISYGLYIWHLVVFKLVLGWPLGLPTTFAVAVLSYNYIERPFLRRRRSESRSVALQSTQIPSAATA